MELSCAATGLRVSGQQRVLTWPFGVRVHLQALQLQGHRGRARLSLTGVTEILTQDDGLLGYTSLVRLGLWGKGVRSGERGPVDATAVLSWVDRGLRSARLHQQWELCSRQTLPPLSWGSWLRGSWVGLEEPLTVLPDAMGWEGSGSLLAEPVLC